MALSLANSAVGSFGALNGYWGQYSNERLADYCDTGIEYVTLAFVNEAPENSASNYPGTNFAGHCWAGTYKNKDDVESNLLSECFWMKQDINYCKSKGVKILLSIGGEYDAKTSNYEVTTEDNGEYFAWFLYKAFGPYDPTWDGPRPFDASPTEHTSVDGFDFDIEKKFDNAPYIAMANKFRALDPSLILTAAPQCPTDVSNFYLKDLITKAPLDILFIQFYNNIWCDAIPSIIPGDAFNYKEWADILDGSNLNKKSKIFIGLPASPTAAGSGYLQPKALKDLVCKWKDAPHFGGISLWDLTRGAMFPVDGKTYQQHAHDALKYGCDPIPTTTSTTTTISSTSTTSSSSTTSTEVTTTTESTTFTTESSTSTTESSTSTTESSTSTTDSSTSTTESSTSTTDSSTSTTDSSTSTTDSSTSTTESSTSESSTTTEESTSTTESSTSEATSTTEATSTFTTWTPPPGGWNTTTTTTESSTSEATSTTEVTSTWSTWTPPPGGWNSTTTTTSSSSEVTSDGSATVTTTDGSDTSSTTGGAVTSSTDGAITSTTDGAVTSTTDGSDGSDGSVTVRTTTGTGTVSYTTSTAYTTVTRTVTKCPIYVDCPEGGYVTTETIPIYTTVCPVTETEGGNPPHPTSTGGAEEPSHGPGGPGGDEPSKPTEGPGGPGEEPTEGPGGPGEEPTKPSHGPGDEPAVPTDGVPGHDEDSSSTKVTETHFTTLTVSKPEGDETATFITDVPIPTGGLTTTAPGSAPTTSLPPTAGASGVMVGLSTLAAALAVHLFVL